MKSKIDLFDEKSDLIKDILEKSPSLIVTWGSTAFIIIIIIIGYFSWIIKYPDVITCELEVTSSNPPIDLFSVSPGPLKELMVKDNQKVKAGQWLAVLDNTASTEDIIHLRRVVQMPRENLIESLPNNPRLGELQPYYAELSKLVSLYQVQLKMNPELKGVKSNLRRLDKVLAIQDNYRIARKIAFKEYELALKARDRTAILFKSGAVAKADLEKSEAELLSYENKYKAFETNVSIVENDKSLIEKDNSGLLLEKETKDIQMINEINNSVQVLTSKINNWSNRFVIKAPFEGKIYFQNVWQKNQFIKSDQSVFSIEPDYKGTYFGRIKVPIVNSGKVQINQKVNIKLYNYPFEEYGMLSGKVRKINNVVNDNYFIAEVSLDNGLTTNYNKNIADKNLIGSADIITHDLRLIERVAYALIKNFKKT